MTLDNEQCRMETDDERRNPWLCSITPQAMLASGHFQQHQMECNDMRCTGTKNNAIYTLNNAVMRCGNIYRLITG